jgi:glutathione S-transferase
MITLHGFAYSNYYNIVKHVLLYKQIPFEEELQYGDGDGFLEVSPLGKVPAITTEHGQHLSEAGVCCEFLEEAFPDALALLPKDPFERGRVRQLMRVSELYLELPCRRLIPYVVSKSDVPAIVAQEVRDVVQRGVGAMNRLCCFDPYTLGSGITLADIYLRYVLKVVNMGGGKLGWDIVAEVDGLAGWQAMMANTDVAKRIDADEEANGPGFFAHIRQRFGL